MIEFLQGLSLFSLIIVPLIFYFKNLNKNNEELIKIQKINECPKCKSKNIEFDTQGNGCSGTSTIKFKCNNCNYNNVYTVPNNDGCGI